MREVAKDESVKDCVLSEERSEKIYAAIVEAQQEILRREEEERLAEERELIRLGRIYRRNLRRRKYVVLAAILVLSLAFGINCFGSVDRMFHKLKFNIWNREREVVDTGDILQLAEISEEEAFAQIEEEYGFHPVRLDYRPEGSEFIEMNIHEDIPKISMIYGTESGLVIEYDVFPRYRESSISKDMEDVLVDQYTYLSDGVLIEIKEYLVNNMEKRWLIQFEYGTAYYWINVLDVEKGEMQKMVESFYFYNKE